MHIHCYCGRGYELHCKHKKQLLVGFDAFCGEECLYELLVSEGYKDQSITSHPEIEPSRMESPTEYWCNESHQFFRSRLEATFARWCDANSIAWEYEPYTIRFNNGRMYTPDFWLPEYSHFVEVKGVWGGSAKRKLRKAQSLGFRILLVSTHLIYKLTRISVK